MTPRVKKMNKKVYRVSYFMCRVYFKRAVMTPRVNIKNKKVYRVSYFMCRVTSKGQ